MNIFPVSNLISESFFQRLNSVLRFQSSDYSLNAKNEKSGFITVHLRSEYRGKYLVYFNALCTYGSNIHLEEHH